PRSRPRTGCCRCSSSASCCCWSVSSTRRPAAAPPSGAPLRPPPQGRRRRTLRLLLALELLAGQDGARRQGSDLLVAHVARRPAEAAVGVDVELLGLADGKHAFDAPGDVLRRLRVEALDVDDARAQLAVLAVLLPQVELGELATRELEDELIGARLENAREVR